MFKLIKRIFYKKYSLFLLIALPVFMISGCIDDSPLKDMNGNDIGNYQFASGPVYGNYYSFADGIIDAAGETMGIFMNNVATNGSLDNAERLVGGNTYLGDAYMAMMQEDIYEYVRKQCTDQFNTDPDSVNKKYLKIASRTKVLLALYTETVHLLVNTSSTPAINSVSGLTTGHDVNMGPANSGTYVTASNILNAWGETAHTSHYDDASVGVQKVVSGEYDAAFFVTATPSSLFKNIAANAPVKLIQVQMPEGAKTYSEDGSILAGDYPFQNEDISGNISVKTLLVGGPNFDDKNLKNFLDYIFDNAEEYKAYNQKWGDLSLALSQNYMKANPEKCNFRAICYASGFPEPDPSYIEDNFFTDYGVSAYHDMYVELDYLLTLNAGIGLKEVNTTGTWENAYRMMRGEGLMALVQDDIFEYLKNNDDMYDSMIAASMKKLVPLHYEYVHLVTDGVYNDVSTLLAAASHVNVGPKTSGTFLTAMNIINSYSVNADISYYFDEPSDALTKVNNIGGTYGDISNPRYHAVFIVSGVPFNKFYSHDTWDITASLANVNIIGALFNSGTPYPYKEGCIAGDSTVGDYPYNNDLVDPPTVITTRVRALQVVSPVFDNNNIDIYLKSVFRKAYYMTVPPDLDYSGSFKTNPLWIPIHKESMTQAEAEYPVGEYTDTYGEDVEGVMEYFVNNPFGWHDAAADYYLTMFPDN